MNRSLADRLALIVVTEERDLPGGRSLIDTVRAALRGGTPSVQLRSKAASGREMVALARALLAETRAAGALLWVNDRLDVALAAGADGAHLGQDDVPLVEARRLAPAGFLLGTSVATVAEAQAAEREGADYLGAGAVYETGSKADAGAPVGTARIGEIAAAVRIPVVGIGGIGLENSAEVAAAGAAGVAVIRAVMHAADPEAATRRLLHEVERGRQQRIEP
jgi:thiamine-phosphate pyrophosphorylase